MTETTLAPAATPAGGGRFDSRRLIGGLAVTQTVGYGVMYYAFAVLLTPIAADTPTSTDPRSGKRCATPRSGSWAEPSSATIAKPAIVADRYGTARYATIAASMATPITLARAFAPIDAAVIAPNAFLTTAGILCLASAALLWSTRSSPAGHPIRSASS